jgi:hypothetical protein
MILRWSKCPPHLTGNSIEELKKMTHGINLVILSADHSMNILDLATIILRKVVAMRKPSSGVDKLLLERVWQGRLCSCITSEIINERHIKSQSNFNFCCSKIVGLDLLFNWNSILKK